MYRDEDSVRDGEFIRARTSTIDAKVEHLSRRLAPGEPLRSLCGMGTPWPIPTVSRVRRRLPLCKMCARRRAERDVQVPAMPPASFVERLARDTGIFDPSTVVDPGEP